MAQFENKPQAEATIIMPFSADTRHLVVLSRRVTRWIVPCVAPALCTHTRSPSNSLYLLFSPILSFIISLVSHCTLNDNTLDSVYELFYKDDGSSPPQFIFKLEYWLHCLITLVFISYSPHSQSQLFVSKRETRIAIPPRLNQFSRLKLLLPFHISAPQLDIRKRGGFWQQQGLALLLSSQCWPIWWCGYLYTRCIWGG